MVDATKNTEARGIFGLTQVLCDSVPHAEPAQLELSAISNVTTSIFPGSSEAATSIPVGILHFLWTYGGLRFSVTFSKWQLQVDANISNLTSPCVFRTK